VTWWEMFLSWFNKDTNTLSLDAIVGDLATEIYYKELAIQSCINLIANTVARSQFRTYERGKEVKRDNYYLLNIEPNPNKSASKFWRDVIHKLVYENECLVVWQGDSLYVADSFKTHRFAFKEYIYSDIVIDDYALNNTYRESQVFHFELHDHRIKAVIDGLYASYAKLIAASQKRYLNGSVRRGALTIPTSYPQTDKAQAELKDLLDKRFKRFFSAEGDAVIPLTNGMTYEEPKAAIEARSGIPGRDIRAFVDDVFDLVAVAFQVPPHLLKGDLADTDKALNNFLTFCVNPLAELLTDEINRKMYGKEKYLERTYMKLDTSRIRAVDIKDIANALDVLVRIGAYCVDDCLEVLGMEPFNTDWSQARFITKNYEPIEKALEGGG